MTTESGFALERLEPVELTIDQTPAGAEEVSATAIPYAAHSPEGHTLDLLYVRASNGERWVEARRIESPSARLRHLDGRRRLTLLPAPGGRHFCELRHARPDGGSWSTLVKASLEELDSAAGVSVTRELRGAGAVDLGTRAAVLGESGRRRSFLCALFERDDEAVPVLAFLLTRVVPLSRS